MPCLSITTELDGPATTIRPMLETLGPVNCKTVKHERSAISFFLCEWAYVGDRCGEKGVLLMSKSQSAVTVVSPYVNDTLRIEGN